MIWICRCDGHEKSISLCDAPRKSNKITKNQRGHVNLSNLRFKRKVRNSLLVARIFWHCRIQGSNRLSKEFNDSALYLAKQNFGINLTFSMSFAQRKRSEVTNWEPMSLSVFNSKNWNPELKYSMKNGKIFLAIEHSFSGKSVHITNRVVFYEVNLFGMKSRENCEEGRSVGVMSIGFDRNTTHSTASPRKAVQSSECLVR